MNVSVVLLKNDRLYRASADRGTEITFGSGKKDTVQVADFASSQITVKINFDSFSVQAKKHYGIEKKNVPFDSFVALDKGSKTYLFVNALSSGKKTTIVLPFDCVIKIGRSAENDIVLPFPFVTGNHLVIKSESGKVRVEDQGTRNGTYLNGKRIGIAQMKSGDTLSILSIQIKLVNGVLSIANVGNNIKVNPI